MRERGVLFNAEMVNAILAGRKTHTRRIVKQQPQAAPIRQLNKEWYDRGAKKYMICPYGKVGDRLWVRENFAVFHVENSWESHTEDGSEYDCAYAYVSYTDGSQQEDIELYIRDDGVDEEIQAKRYCAKHQDGKFNPSIHMPRWASRITLEITDIRVERLQDISEEDTKAEGLAKLSKDSGATWKYGIPASDGLPACLSEAGMVWSEWRQSPIDAFKNLWNSINGKTSWQQNPWVWVVEFKKIEEN